MKKLILLLLIISFTFYPKKICSQKINKELIGSISIFEEPEINELKNWNKFDPFLAKAFDYVANEKAQLLGNPNNPFNDSIFINKFKHITYRTIYESAKAYKDSVYYKSQDIKRYSNIYLWAKEKFPEFMQFREEYNEYLERNLSRL